MADEYVRDESDTALQRERAANQRGLIEAARPHARPMQRNRCDDDIVAILGQMANQLLRNHAGQSDLSAIFLTGVRLLQTGRHISPRRECRHALAVWPDMPRNSFAFRGHIQMALRIHGTMAGQETAIVASNRRKMVRQRALSCRNMGSVRAAPN